MMDSDDEPLKVLDPIGSAPVSPSMGIAAIALSMAMKYHDINTVQDGALYQQYKMEGKNMHSLHLDHVFQTAARIELYLVGASKRVANLIADALTYSPEDFENIPVEADGIAEVPDGSDPDDARDAAINSDLTA